MNKKIPMYKRVGATFLCLALLCGVIVGTGAFPQSQMTAQADAVSAVESFEADFADLAALVGTEQWDASTNRYCPAQADTAIQNWIKARFGLYMNRETSAYKPVAFLGQKSFAISGLEWQGSDGWGGEYWWEITKDGGLYNHTGKVGGQMLRKNNALALKYSDGELIQLSNFEANIVFNKPVNELGAVWLSFHQAEPGRMTTNTNNGANTCNGTVALIGNGPVGAYNNKNASEGGHYGAAVKDGITLGSLSGKDDRTVDAHFANDLELGVDYNLYVKVVGTKMNAKVTKVSDGSVVYTGEADIPEGNGYISVGVANSKRVLKKIQVTELNASGEAVDFGASKAFKWTTSGKTGYANGKHTYNTPDNTADDKDWFDFAESANNGKADKTSIINALNKNFDIYYNSEGRHYQMQAGDKAAYDGQSGDYGWFRGVYEDVWLQRPIGGNPNNYSQNLRLITSLVPKQNNKALAYTNFETTFRARLDNADATIVFGFRQKTPGKFTDGYFNVNKQQGLVSITQTGIVVSGGDNIYSGHTNNQPNPGDMYDTDATATFATPIVTGSSKNGVTVYVKAVGDQVTVKVTAGDNSVTYYDQTVTVPYTEAGYLAYGIANRNSDLGNITLTHLDANGNVIPTNEMTDDEAAVFAEPWNLSLIDLPGAEYTGGKYTASGQNYTSFGKFSDTKALDYVSQKVDFYYNHESSNYEKVPAYGNTNGSGNWSLFQNHWIQRTNAAGWGERLRQINALVPKDSNGVQAQMKNLSASFNFRFENGNKGTGGPSTLVFGFRQKNPAKFVNGYNAPNQEQVLVAITQKSIAVAGGTDITQERFYHYDQFADDACGDVFSADLPQNISVKLEAIGKNVTVKIYNWWSGALVYSGTFEVNYTKEGYMAFGIAAAGGNYGELKLNRLDNNGNAIDFTDDSYMDTAWPDGKTRFNASFATLARQVSAFTGGEYTSTKDDADINAWVSQRFELWYNRETPVYQRQYLGQSSNDFDANDNYGGVSRWVITEDGTLKRTATKIGGEWMRKYDLLVAKAPNGIAASLQNFETEFVVNDTELKRGTVTLSFRNEDKGKVTTGWKGVSDKQQFVSVGFDADNKFGVSIAGTVLQGGNGHYCYSNEDVTALNTVKEYKVYVKALNDKITVKITSVDGSTTYYTNETAPVTATVTAAGYIALGVSGSTKGIKSWVITELDKNGDVVDFGSSTKGEAAKFYFTINNLIEYTGGKYTASKVDAEGNPILNPDGTPFAGYNYYNFAGKYGDNAHPAASTIINYLDSKMAFYYNNEGKYYQMQAGASKAYDGQTADTGAFSSLYANLWFQRNGSFGGTQNFRMINSMVPRNSLTGEELQFENFETSFKIRFEATDPHAGTALVGFRQATPGKFTNGYWNINKDQAFVAVTRAGITIAGGDQIVSNMAKDPETGKDLHQSAEGDMYNEDQTAKFASALPQEVIISVKVVGDKVTVKVTNTTGTTVYYDNSDAPATVNRTGSGYLAYGLGSKKMNIADIELTRLNANGEKVDVNGSDSLEDCPWDTAADRYSESMNQPEEDLEELYKFYYSAMVSGTPTTVNEALDAHWEVNDSGVLMRKNDLGGNATEKLAMINMTNVKLKNFDAIFKLQLDEKQEGTFWVTARQADATKIGKVVATPGNEDFIAGQLAVGLAVGGDIIIANGTDEPIVLPGSAIGTPTGTYTFRVRVFGNTVEVYNNGVLRTARVMNNLPTDEGYLTFGYSGAELGIGAVDVIRLNDQGVAVNMDSEYVSVDNPTAPIIVGAGADFATEVLPKLPATVTVHKADNSSTPMNVYWDPNSVDLSTDGDYLVVGYLEDTNDVRAAAPVLVGKFDREITVQYTFDDESQLDSFESWFMPTTSEYNQPALHTEGTANDGWELKNGRLTQKNTSIRLADGELLGGKEIGGVTYQDDRHWRGYASNFSVAVLKDKTYKNFIMEVDVVPNYRWTLVGFGAKDYNDATSVFPTQKNGGYSFHVEHNSGTNSGTAKFWGYDPAKDTSATLATALIQPYDLSKMVHIKIIVSDGHVWYYVGDNTIPFEADLPETYDGGYLFFASNENGGGFDNLRITDLDTKTINIAEILTPAPALMTIDRSVGESLAVESTGILKAADENGYEYELPYALSSSTYRSNKEGMHEFFAEFAPFHGMTVASGLEYKLTVDNQINGDFDPAKSVKYYFDHPNDFLDFTSQYSKPTVLDTAVGPKTYYSAFDGELVPIEATERWTIRGGKLANSYSFNPGGWGGIGKTKGVSTLVLKDINLMNYRLEVDFKHGTNFWYQYVLCGVQDPTKTYGLLFRATTEENRLPWVQWFEAEYDTGPTSTQYMSSLGGGIWAHLEQEGYFNIQGAIDGGTDQRYTNDLSTDFIATYDKTQEHHMVITVVDGLMSIQVDDSDIYYAAVGTDAWGGLVGLGAHGNGGTFDNFQITALDLNGQETTMDQAEKGWRPEPMVDTYEGWQPAKNEWFFEWGDEYLKELENALM